MVLTNAEILRPEMRYYCDQGAQKNVQIAHRFYNSQTILALGQKKVRLLKCWGFFKADILLCDQSTLCNYTKSKKMTTA